MVMWRGRWCSFGYGICAPSLKYDDYSGLDVKGKIVRLPWVPEGVDDSKGAPGARGKKLRVHHCAVASSQCRQSGRQFSLQGQDFQGTCRRSGIDWPAKNDEGGLPSSRIGPDLAEKILAPMALI